MWATHCFKVFRCVQEYLIPNFIKTLETCNVCLIIHKIKEAHTLIKLTYLRVPSIEPGYWPMNITQKRPVLEVSIDLKTIGDSVEGCRGRRKSHVRFFFAAYSFG